MSMQAQSGDSSQDVLLETRSSTNTACAASDAPVAADDKSSHPNVRVRALVLSTWLAMMLIALVNWHQGSRNVPFSEDWLLVPALTGHESNLFEWLWSQHNEHRVPVPRVILLALLGITHGDFRVGGAFTILLLSAVALAMIETARSLRGGKQRVTDAFFPVALLHLGHSENMLWSWQLTQVIPVVLSLLLMAIMVSGRFPSAPQLVIPAALFVLLLPLCGANGLLVTPFFALWTGYIGIQLIRGRYVARSATMSGAYLLTMSVLVIVLCGLYFLNFKLPSHGAGSPTPFAALYASLQFLALGFGPAARSSWTLAIILIISFLIPALMLSLQRLISKRDSTDGRALGVALFGCNLGLLAMAIGWGRAEVLALSLWGGMWPARYSLFAVPLLCLAYFIYELYGSSSVRAAFQYALFALVVLLIPLNVSHGARWSQWYLEGAGAFDRDVRAGVPLSKLAETNREYLYRWMDYNFDKLRMLQESRLGIFKYMPNEASPSGSIATPASAQSSRGVTAATRLVHRKFLYEMPEADDVSLVWGVDGWRHLPDMLRPAGTVLNNNVMRTVMTRKKGLFVTELALPAGISIDYCFLLAKKRDAFEITWPICDGDHHERVTSDGTTNVASKLSLRTVVQEIRYYLPEAEEVELVWGLNGWHSAPESLRPKGTILANKVMHSPMTLHDKAFVISLSVPVGTPIDYGFQIIKRRGLFDLVHPVFDGGYAVRAQDGSVVDIHAKPGLLP